MCPRPNVAIATGVSYCPNDNTVQAVVFSPCFSLVSPNQSSQGHLPGWNDIINLEDTTHTLSSQSHSTGVNKKWLEDRLLRHVSDGTTADIDTRETLTVDVPVPELRHNVHRVETGILSKSVWHNFKGLSEGTNTVRFLTIESPGILAQFDGKLDFRGTTTTNEELLLYEAAGGTKRVMEGALSLIEKHLVGSPEENSGDTAHVLNTRDLDDLTHT